MVILTLDRVYLNNNTEVMPRSPQRIGTGSVVKTVSVKFWKTNEISFAETERFIEWWRREVQMIKVICLFGRTCSSLFYSYLNNNEVIYGNNHTQTYTYWFETFSRSVVEWIERLLLKRLTQV